MESSRKAPLTPQHTVTLLKGEENWYSARKVYQKHSDGTIRKISDFKLGKKFYWKQYQLTPGDELASLQQLIRQVEHDKRIFRIYGNPREEFRSSNVVERSGDFFAEPEEGARLLMIDVDGWESTHQWDWDDGPGITRAIHSALVMRGLDFLSRHPCLLMWSQSAVSPELLKCHLYYWLEKPISLETLRDWGRYFNAKQQSKVIDGSVFRAVQPDYIARRRIEDEDGQDAEMIPAQQRMLLLQGFKSDEPLPSMADTILAMVEGIRGEIEKGGVTLPAGVVLESDGWATLAKAGSGGEINEYAYRAAAQIVAKAGKRRTLANLEDIARHMHKILWENVDINSNGVRGGREDRDTYSIRRMSQYLRSACDASIGDSCDNLLLTVETAIKEFPFNPERIFEQDVLIAAATLKNRFPGSFALVRQQLKSSKVPVSISEWSKRLDNVARPKPDLDPLLGGTEPDGGYFAGGEFNEQLFINAVISCFRFFRSPTGDAFYIDLADMATRTDGGYFGRSAIRSLRSDITVRAMALADGQFTFSDMICSRIVDSIFVGIDRGEGSVVEEGRHFATRVHGCSRGATWVNVGRGMDGTYRCLRVDHMEVRSMTWQESLEYPDAPVWHHEATMEIPFVHNGKMDWTLEGLLEVMEGGGLRDAEWARELFEILRVEGPEDEMATVGFICGELASAENSQVAQILGVHGSGKSMAGDILCELINPMMTSLFEKSPHRMGAYKLQSGKFLQGLFGRNIAVIDNPSGLTAQQQDLLCSVCTGMVEEERILYTHVWVKKPIRCSVVLACLGGIITRPDLRDRSVVIHIRPASQDDPYSHLVRDEHWPAVRTRIFQGLIELASAVKAILSFADSGKLDLQEMGVSSVGGSGRNLIHEIAKRLYMGKDYGAIRTDERSAEARQLVQDDLFASGLCAWLYEEGDSLTNTGVAYGMAELLRMYRHWIENNSGKTIFWRTVDSVPMESRIVMRSGEKQIIPSTPQRFSFRLTQFAHEVERLLNFRWANQRNKVSRGLVFERGPAVKRILPLDEFDLDLSI